MRRLNLLRARSVKVWIALMVLLCMLFTGCTPHPSNVGINEEALKSTYAFAKPKTAADIPDQMIDVLGKYKVVLVGEIHYAKEHQEMTSVLLERLHEKGLRYYAQEVGVSQGYLIDCYIKGKVDMLEDVQYKADEIVIESLKHFNAELRAANKADQQISFIGFDINHLGVEYYTAMHMLGDLYEVDALQVYGKSLYDAGVRTPKYKELIKTFVDLLGDTEASSNPYQKLSADEKAILIQLSETEKTSIDFRYQKSDFVREDFIYEQVHKLISQLKADEKVLINCGSWHAQYINEWQVSSNDDFKWLGMRLKEDFSNQPYGLYNYAVTTYKASLKMNLFDDARKNYALNTTDKEAFVKQLQMTFGDKTVFADFSPLAGNSNKLLIHYPTETTYLKPNEHFNGLLVYPEVSVAEGCVFYER